MKVVITGDYLVFHLFFQQTDSRIGLSRAGLTDDFFTPAVTAIVNGNAQSNTRSIIHLQAVKMGLITVFSSCLKNSRQHYNNR